MKRAHGIILYSGGLDSLLSAAVLRAQNVELTGFHCILPFVPPETDPATLPAAKFARQINLNLKYYWCGDEYIEMLRNPPHGYGKQMNPCIDCKIFFLKKAREYMQTVNADFVATGEVVGQRPMSQMRDTLNHIEKESGLKGRLLRPLSAHLLRPTIAEEKGLINRDLLYQINGRSRKEQFALAEKFGIKEFASPAGGCFLTEPGIAQRVKDLFEHHSSTDKRDFYLLTVGRHFRLDEKIKIIVGRNEEENNKLDKYRDYADYFCIPDFKGPTAYVLADKILSIQAVTRIGEIIYRYGKATDTKNDIIIYKKGISYRHISIDSPINDVELNKMRI